MRISYFFLWNSCCSHDLVTIYENIVSLGRSKRVPLSSTQIPSVQHISSTQGPHLFRPKNPPVSHQKLLSSTHPPPQFNTSPTPKIPQFHTENPSVPHQNVLNCGGCGTEREPYYINIFFFIAVELEMCL